MAVAGQLDSEEPALQAAALRCLQAFKHKYLNEHMERLLRCALCMYTFAQSPVSMAVTAG